MYSLCASFNSVRLGSPLNAPGVMKEMLLWSSDKDRRAGRVPNALSDKNLIVFLSKLIAEASHGNSLRTCDNPDRSQRTAQFRSRVQVHEGGHNRTQAQEADTCKGASKSTET